MEIHSKRHSLDSRSDKALMIVDMQERFLPIPCEMRSAEYAKARICLVENILGRIDEYRDSGQNIILVKYEGGGDIDAEISKAAKSGKTREVPKLDESLLYDARGRINDRVINILRGYGDCRFEIVGINATVCVMRTAISLMDHGFDVGVNPKCIMDCFPLNKFDGESFLKRNTLSLIQKSYKDQNIVHNLDFSVKRRRNAGGLLGLEGKEDFGDTYTWNL